MTTLKFPLNYVATIFSPVKCFTNRQGYTWWQVLLLILLIVSLLLAPMGLVLGKMTYIGFEQFMPKAESLLTDDVAQRMTQVQWSEVGERELIAETDSGQVWLVSDIANVPKDGNVVGIAPNAFLMREENRASMEQVYQMPLEMKDFASGATLKRALSQRWFDANRAAILLTVFINTWFLIISSFVLLLFGVAGLLSFMRLTPVFSINSFREALAVCLNCFGLPTILAMLFGYLTVNPVHVLTAQGLIFLLMLALVYWQTRFQDRYLMEKEMKGNTNSPK